MLNTTKTNIGKKAEISLSKPSSSWFRRKKEWLRLNSSAAIGIAVATTATYAVPYFAEQCGVEREQAATWWSAVSNFILGNGAVLLSSWALNRKNPGIGSESPLKYSLKIMRKSMFAGILSVAAMWGTAYAALSCGASSEAAETVGLAANYAAYLSLFNLLNRKKMSEQTQN